MIVIEQLLNFKCKLTDLFTRRWDPVGLGIHPESDHFSFTLHCYLSPFCYSKGFGQQSSNNTENKEKSVLLAEPSLILKQCVFLYFQPLNVLLLTLQGKSDLQLTQPNLTKPKISIKNNQVISIFCPKKGRGGGRFECSRRKTQVTAQTKISASICRGNIFFILFAFSYFASVLANLYKEPFFSVTQLYCMADFLKLEKLY